MQSNRNASFQLNVHTNTVLTPQNAQSSKKGLEREEWEKEAETKAMNSNQTEIKEKGATIRTKKNCRKIQLNPSKMN